MSIDPVLEHFGNWWAVAIWFLMFILFLAFLPFYKKSQRKPASVYGAFVLALAPFFTQASRMFHSLGTVQSKTSVPLGTSSTVSSTCARSRRSVSRTPSPVMLRQIG